jgi:hypothetical protein
MIQELKQVLLMVAVVNLFLSYLHIELYFKRFVRTTWESKTSFQTTLVVTTLFLYSIRFVSVQSVLFSTRRDFCLLVPYLNISLRTVLPLDWDHVWSEFSSGSINDVVQWDVQDPNERNFCCGLDEGIGSWTAVWEIHPDPSLCQDIPEGYLSCTNSTGTFGRSEPQYETYLPRYQETVQTARQDSSGDRTQAGTICSFALHRAQMNCSSEQITTELQRAARDVGAQEWWQV